MVKFVKLLAVIAWLILIFTASQMQLPTPDPSHQPALFDYVFDKDMHALLFGVLAFLICALLIEWKMPQWRVFYLAAFFCFAYGITDEYHQGFVLGREVSYWDLLFDAIGGTFGAATYFLFSTKIHKSS